MLKGSLLGVKGRARETGGIVIFQARYAESSGQVNSSGGGKKSSDSGCILKIGCFVCQSQSTNNQCCGWTSPRGSCYDCKTSFSHNHQETLKKQKFITYRTWKLPSTPGVTQQGHWQRGGTGLRFCFYWGWGWGPGVLPGPLFMDELKTQEQEFKMWEEQKQVVPMVSYWNQPRPLKHGASTWKGGPALYLIL